MSIYEARPTLIDSDVEIQAAVEQTEEGVAVFLRVMLGVEETTPRFDAAHWRAFVAAVEDMIQQRINEANPAAHRGATKKAKAAQ